MAGSIVVPQLETLLNLGTICTGEFLNPQLQVCLSVTVPNVHILILSNKAHQVCLCLGATQHTAVASARSAPLWAHTGDLLELPKEQVLKQQIGCLRPAGCAACCPTLLAIYRQLTLMKLAQAAACKAGLAS